MKKYLGVVYTNTVKRNLEELGEVSVHALNKKLNFYDYIYTFLTMYDTAYLNILNSIEKDGMLTKTSINNIVELNRTGLNIVKVSKNKILKEDYDILVEGIYNLLDYLITEVKSYSLGKIKNIRVNEVYDSVLHNIEKCELLFKDF